MGIPKSELLRDIFLLHWDWDSEPDYDNTDEDDPVANVAGSTEDLVLKMYDRFKKDALEKYNWRSAIRYETITCTVPVTNKDKRYRYNGSVPEDFIKLVGLWQDEERYIPAIGMASIVDTTVFSHLASITIGYMADISETEYDNWLTDYMIAYIASVGAPLAGVSNDKRAELISLEQNKLYLCSNIDYEMEQKDSISPSLTQFLIS